MKKIPQLSDGPDDEAADDASRSGRREDDGGVSSGDAPAGGEVRTSPAGHRADEREDVGASASAGRESAGGRTGGAGRGRARGGRPARGPARRFARERALQALYQWDLADAESSTVRLEFIERQDMSRVDVDYFERLFRGVSHDVDAVDAHLADALDRPIAEVDPIERAVLRIAAFELAEVLETPARVVINEGVEITKRFGADNGHRYVNGVLDGLAATLRPLEMRRG